MIFSQASIDSLLCYIIGLLDDVVATIAPVLVLDRVLGLNGGEAVVGVTLEEKTGIATEVELAD